MKAIILAAGRGRRMKDLTDERPKCLVELRGKTLLDWQLEALRKAGIKEIAIVTGYRRELLTNRKLVEFHNARWAKTNMVSSLACAEAWLKVDPCIVSYSDIFYSSTAVESLMACTASLAVTYDPNWLKLWTQRFGDPLLDAETFRLTTDHTLAEIGNKPKSVGEVQGQYMGLLRIAPEGWKELMSCYLSDSQSKRDLVQMTTILNEIIQRGNLPIQAVKYDGAWGEVDVPMDLECYPDSADKGGFPEKNTLY